MKLYNGGSVNWMYDGEMTEEEMRADKRCTKLFEEPCVIYDDGSGKAFGFDTLEKVCTRYSVPYRPYCPDQSFQNVIEAIGGEYKAPGVTEVEVIATEAKATAEQAKQTADEAKDAAAQAGTDPQLQALATLQVQTMDLAPMAASDLAAFRDYWPEWKPDTQYKQNDPLRYKGVYYRVSQDTTSSDVYPPDTAGESLYYPVTIAPDGIIVYRECHGEYDMVRKGETRHYPDAEGPVYRAKVDTAYDPDTVPGNWELVGGETEGTEPEQPEPEPEPEPVPSAPEFVQPTGSHDAYNTGDRVTYGGKVYESTIDGNVWSPDAYPAGWQLED